MPETAFRSKRVCLSPIDWQAFSAALVETYRGAQYIPELLSYLCRDEVPPEQPVMSSLADAMAHSSYLEIPDRPDIAPKWIPTTVVKMTFDPTWQPRWRRDPDGGNWYIPALAYPSVRFRPGGNIRVDEPGWPPYITHGEIVFYCDPDIKEDFAEARRFYKLFRQFATNTNQIGYTYPDYQVLWTIEKGSDTWLGHDAIRWAREDKKRLLYYDHRGWGYRPNDEGIVKPAK